MELSQQVGFDLLDLLLNLFKPAINVLKSTLGLLLQVSEEVLKPLLISCIHKIILLSLALQRRMLIQSQLQHQTHHLLLQ